MLGGAKPVLSTFIRPSAAGFLVHSELQGAGRRRYTLSVGGKVITKSGNATTLATDRSSESEVDFV